MYFAEAGGYQHLVRALVHLPSADREAAVDDEVHILRLGGITEEVGGSFTCMPSIYHSSSSGAEIVYQFMMASLVARKERAGALSQAEFRTSS